MKIRPFNLARYQAKGAWILLSLVLFLGLGFCALAPLSARAESKGADATVNANAAQCPALLNRSFKKLQDESNQSLCQYAGKVVLVVNTASYCGFTGQYEGLEALYAKYADKGLVVLGFPSNDFSQEPGSNKEVADFCYNTYGVKFPMFIKSSVVGADANPLYLDLAKQTGKRPSWNFYKYLLDRNGKPVASYASIVTPTDRSFVSQIESLLAAKSLPTQLQQ